MKGVWFFGNNYVIPNTDNVVLGGTQQKDRWDTNVDIKDTEMILSRIGSVFPALARAPIVRALLCAKLTRELFLMVYTLLLTYRKTFGLVCVLVVRLFASIARLWTVSSSFTTTATVDRALRWRWVVLSMW